MYPRSALQSAVFACLALSGLVSCTDFKTHIESVKRESKAELVRAAAKASQYGTDSCHDLLMTVVHRLERIHLRSASQLASRMRQRLLRLEPTLRLGAKDLSRAVNVTLDGLGRIADAVQTHGHYQMLQARVVPSQLDQTLHSGRDAVEEVSVELLNNILHVMGDYFKGLVVHTAPMAGRAARHAVAQRSPYMQWELMRKTEISPEMRQIAHNTFDIVNAETEKILKEVDDIADVIRYASRDISSHIAFLSLGAVLTNNQQQVVAKQIFEKHWELKFGLST